MEIKTEGLDHIAITVADMERSIRWYEDVLGLSNPHPGVWDGVPTMMFSGKSGLALFPARDGATRPDSLRGLIAAQHIAFRVDHANFEAAQNHLKKLDIAFEFQDHGISHSIYFHDPDGHQLELTTYDL